MLNVVMLSVVAPSAYPIPSLKKLTDFSGILETLEKI
jgi:hypothetical protein